MVTLSVAITILAVLLLLLGLRGRVIARGCFCRACGFDLAGIDPASDARCPECGRLLARRKATRSVTRRRRGRLLALACVALLLAVAGFAASAPGVRPRLVARLPDAVLARLDRLHAADIRVEAIARLRDPASPHPGLRPLIDRATAGMERDPASARDLEVIAAALVGRRLSPPDLQSLCEKMFKSEILVRDRVRPGDDDALVWTRVSSVIDLPLTPTDLAGLSAMYELTTRFHCSRADQRSPAPWEPGGRSASSIGSYSFGPRSESTGAHVPLARVAVAGKVSSLPVRSQVQFLLRDKVSDQVVGDVRHTIDTALALAVSDDPGLPMIEDAGLLARWAEAISVAPFRIPRSGLRLGPGQRIDWVPIWQYSEQLNDASAAYRVSVLAPDGELWPIGWAVFVARANTRRTFSSMPLNMSLQGRSERDAWVQRLRAITEAGRVDLLYEPDPWLARDYPEIRSILAGSLIIRDVPVQFVSDDEATKGDTVMDGPLFRASVFEPTGPDEQPADP